MGSHSGATANPKALIASSSPSLLMGSDVQSHGNGVKKMSVPTTIRNSSQKKAHIKMRKDRVDGWIAAIAEIDAQQEELNQRRNALMLGIQQVLDELAHEARQALDALADTELQMYRIACSNKLAEVE
jgi:hypothetical protein